MRRPKVADSTGAELTGAGLLTRTLIFRRLLRREVLAPDERNVGLLLPPTAAAVVANAALSIDRRVAVNLNYTLAADVIDDCIAQCGIRHVLTSRRFVEKLDLKFAAEAVYLEDFKAKVSWIDKLAAAVVGLADADLVAGKAPRTDRNRRRRPVDGHFHLRFDRPAQGGDAHPPQRRLEHRGLRPDHPPFARRTCCWASCPCSTPSATR